MGPSSSEVSLFVQSAFSSESTSKYNTFFRAGLNEPVHSVLSFAGVLFRLLYLEEFTARAGSIGGQCLRVELAVRLAFVS